MQFFFFLHVYNICRDIFSLFYPFHHYIGFVVGGTWLIKQDSVNLLSGHGDEVEKKNVEKDHASGIE